MQKCEEFKELKINNKKRKEFKECIKIIERKTCKYHKECRKCKKSGE